jgi:hypothetical protein
VAATVGLHGSASTWVFNVVRELIIAATGEARVVSCYADEENDLPVEAERTGRFLVVKSHHGSLELDAWLAAEQATMFLSVRDPRDACISMAQRFRVPLERTVRWIANDCNRVMRLSPAGHTLLRYEDRFFDDPGSVARLAEVLDLRPSRAERELIFSRYRTEAVQSFAQQLTDLPPDRLTLVGRFAMDRVTQILGPHIGDGRSGKWQGLPEQPRQQLTKLFGPFLERFGYPR